MKLLLFRDVPSSTCCLLVLYFKPDISAVASWTSALLRPYNTPNIRTDSIIVRPLVIPPPLLTLLIKNCSIAKSFQVPAQSLSDLLIVSWHCWNKLYNQRKLVNSLSISWRYSLQISHIEKDLSIQKDLFTNQ